MIRLFVAAILVVLIAPAAIAEPIKTPADVVRWLHKRLYPSQYVQAAPEPPKPAPRLRVKRGFKKTPPPVADTPQTETAPRVTPAPPRGRGKAKPQPRPKAVPRQAPRVSTGVSARDCARLRAAYVKHGDLINMGGQGYSPAQVAYARRQCRV